MTTDRELLEAAARAAGVAICDFDSPCLVRGDTPVLTYWNPLTDDGDALRLAVALTMAIEYRGERSFDLAPLYVKATPYIEARRSHDESQILLHKDRLGYPANVSAREDYRHDDEPPRNEYDKRLSKAAATRRAIVRAAAGIGAK